MAFINIPFFPSPGNLPKLIEEIRISCLLMKCFFQISKCQETGVPIIPLNHMTLNQHRTWGPDGDSSRASSFFPNVDTVISRVCLSPQTAAFSVHPGKWSHRTPANSLNAPGACHFCLPHLSLLSTLGPRCALSSM